VSEARPPRCAVASEPPGNEKEGNDESENSI
jgi:hypothetical protein